MDKSLSGPMSQSLNFLALAIGHLRLFLLLSALSLSLAACSGPTRANPEAARTQASQAKAKVVVSPAQRRDLVRKIALPGSMVAFNETTLYGKLTGYLRSISVDKGDTVRRGPTLAG